DGGQVGTGVEPQRADRKGRVPDEYPRPVGQLGQRVRDVDVQDPGHSRAPTAEVYRAGTAGGTRRRLGSIARTPPKHAATIPATTTPARAAWCKPLPRKVSATPRRIAREIVLRRYRRSTSRIRRPPSSRASSTLPRPSRWQRVSRYRSVV